MAKRTRPGKRERETSVKAAIRKVRNAKMDETRKVIGLLREEQRLARGRTVSVPCLGPDGQILTRTVLDRDANQKVVVATTRGPNGYATSSANRDKLKGGTGSVGFYGGRGFYSEKLATGPIDLDKARDMTAKQHFAPKAPRPNGPTSKRFAEDTFPVEKPSLTVERRAGKRERFKVVGKVRVRLPDPTVKK